MTRSLRHRFRRRRRSPYVWGVVHMVSPYVDRLKLAALGDHICQPFVVHLKGSR